MISLGIDPGYGNFKVALITAEEARFVAVGETDVGLLGLGNVTRRRCRVNHHRLEVNEEAITRMGTSGLRIEEVRR